MPISTLNAQNSACIVVVEMRLIPKLITMTMASGASATIQRSGVPNTASAMPEVANSSATMPESSTPEAM